MPVEVDSSSKRGRTGVIREASSSELLVLCNGGFYVGERVQVRLICDAAGGDPEVPCTVMRCGSTPVGVGYRHQAVLRVEDPAFDRKYELAVARVTGRFEHRLAS